MSGESARLDKGVRLNKFAPCLSELFYTIFVRFMAAQQNGQGIKREHIDSRWIFEVGIRESVGTAI